MTVSIEHNPNLTRCGCFGGCSAPATKVLVIHDGERAIVLRETIRCDAHAADVDPAKMKAIIRMYARDPDRASYSWEPR